MKESALPSAEENWPTRIDRSLPASMLSLNDESNPQIFNAFSAMETSELKFNNYVQRLSKQNNIRVLYHKSWHQPVNDKTIARPLFIQAGNIFDNQYELEGTLKFSVSRYLHVDSDLVFSTFSENEPLLSGWWLNEAQPEKQNDSPYTLEAQELVKQTAGFTPLPGAEINLSQQRPFTQFIKIRQVQLKQSRRMRSGELHYLDHPIIGLLVKLEQYELPEDESESPVNQGDEFVSSFTPQ